VDRVGAVPSTFEQLGKCRGEPIDPFFQATTLGLLAVTVRAGSKRSAPPPMASRDAVNLLLFQILKSLPSMAVSALKLPRVQAVSTSSKAARPTSCPAFTPAIHSPASGKRSTCFPTAQKWYGATSRGLHRTRAS
jgi:hypothetical protein